MTHVYGGLFNYGNVEYQFDESNGYIYDGASGYCSSPVACLEFETGYIYDNVSKLGTPIYCIDKETGYVYDNISKFGNPVAVIDMGERRIYKDMYKLGSPMFSF